MSSMKRRDLLIGQLEIKLFIKPEKVENPVRNHEVRFLETEIFPWDELLFAFNKKSLSYKDIRDFEYANYTMIVKLAGEYGSLDDYKLKRIDAYQKKGITIHMDSVKIDSQDGVPFHVVPFLIIPLNESLINYQKIVFNFSTKIKDFSTGNLRDDLARKIPDFEFSFVNGISGLRRN